MREGDVILAPLPQADGQIKTRPVLLLREMPPYADLLICGISTQTHHLVTGFDELITPGDEDYSSSSLKQESLIRLGFLGLLPRNAVFGKIGNISKSRHERLLGTLAKHLIAKQSQT